MEQNTLATLADAIAYLLSTRHADLEREDATLFGNTTQERRREREIEAEMDELDRYRESLRMLRAKMATPVQVRT